jgi:hypothetical protein
MCLHIFSSVERVANWGRLKRGSAFRGGIMLQAFNSTESNAFVEFLLQADLIGVIIN